MKEATHSWEDSLSPSDDAAVDVMIGSVLIDTMWSSIDEPLVEIGHGTWDVRAGSGAYPQMHFRQPDVVMVNVRALEVRRAFGASDEAKRTTLSSDKAFCRGLRGIKSSFAKSRRNRATEPMPVKDHR